MHIAHIEFSELSRTRLLKALPVYQFLSRTQVLIFSKYEMVEQVWMVDLQSLLQFSTIIYRVYWAVIISIP